MKNRSCACKPNDVWALIRAQVPPAGAAASSQRGRLPSFTSKLQEDTLTSGGQVMSFSKLESAQIQLLVTSPL